MRQRNWGYRALTACLAVLLWTPVSADQPKDRKINWKSPSGGGVHSKIGAKIGGIGSGSISVNGLHVSGTVRSYSWGVYFEEKGPRRFQFGLAFDVHDFMLGESATRRKNFLNASLEIKYRKSLQISRLELRPCAGVGVGYLKPTALTEDAYFLTSKLFAEATYHWFGQHGLTMEIGLTVSPIGRSSKSHLRMKTGPMAVYRVGVFW